MAKKKLKWFDYGNVQMAYTTYKGKTRKGRYVLVKEEGKRSKAYKVKKGLNKVDYHDAYVYGITSKKKSAKSISGKTSADRYLMKIGKRKPIDSLVSGGIGIAGS